MAPKGIYTTFYLLTLTCNYENIEEACQGCSKKGLRCNKEDKVWGQLRTLKTESTLASTDTLTVVHDLTEAAKMSIGEDQGDIGLGDDHPCQQGN